MVLIGTGQGEGTPKEPHCTVHDVHSRETWKHVQWDFRLMNALFLGSEGT